MKCYRCTPTEKKIIPIQGKGGFAIRIELAKDTITRIETKHGLIPCPVCNGRGYIKRVRNGGR